MPVETQEIWNAYEVFCRDEYRRWSAAPGNGVLLFKGAHVFFNHFDLRTQRWGAHIKALSATWWRDRGFELVDMPRHGDPVIRPIEPEHAASAGANSGCQAVAPDTPSDTAGWHAKGLSCPAALPSNRAWAPGTGGPAELRNRK